MTLDLALNVMTWVGFAVGLLCGFVVGIFYGSRS